MFLLWVVLRLQEKIIFFIRKFVYEIIYDVSIGLCINLCMLEENGNNLNVRYLVYFKID